MKSLLPLLALFATLAYAKDYQEVCYDGLGCFSTAPPFSAFGRIALLPDSPEKINTKFFLYTRKNGDNPQKLKHDDVEGLKSSNFDASKPTKFVIHGWIDGDAIAPWLREMAQQFLVEEDCNAIVVDWHGGGRRLYGQSAADTRVAGAVIAQLIEVLQKELGANPEQMHLLGHSLGSHVSGYAGERIPNLGRITGMDPADPYFQNMSREVRLDETDASFVDVIHTDANEIFNLINPFNGQQGMGLWQPSGHVDVYPNGGKKQPGCQEKGPIGQLLDADGLIDGVRDIVACGHHRA